jgi:hypothetical protein
MRISVGRLELFSLEFVWSSERGGLSVEAIARAIHEGRFSLAFLEGPHFRWATLSPRTYTAVSDDLGLPLEFVVAFEEALGKVPPMVDEAAPDDLPEMLEVARLAFDAGVDASTVLRVVRVYADALRRITETEGDVYHRLVETRAWRPVSAMARC